jgi:hypothetical protein
MGIIKKAFTAIFILSAGYIIFALVLMLISLAGSNVKLETDYQYNGKLFYYISVNNQYIDTTATFDSNQAKRYYSLLK